ncbi:MULTISPECIES: hypothetical protein [unclassified Streptomyces]|uniref:hypothetical protein n=1 Tax=unclassified Streptomyces TaxID=2593676 RepID=UPI00114CEBD2|nr:MULTISPECIES: hypothetical protein [unclassified Streptomyces]MDQ0698684.1 hypothetical protein [Streptomyces sp. W4I9-2]MDX3490445.1 hypothetical protein [Streptomyces sp. ID05-18]
MKFPKAQRVFAAVGVTAAAVLVPIATAQPASATQWHCERYLASKGYVIGPKVKNGCSYDTFATTVWCLTNLNAIISNGTHVTEACEYARHRD